MPKFDIIIKNKSGEDQRYLIFNEAPAFSRNKYLNVLMSGSATSSGDGETNFTTVSEIFAICGVPSPNQPHKGAVEITVSDSAPVTLAGQNPGTAVQVDLDGASPAFKTPPSTTTEAGAFVINTGDWSNAEHKIWCGIGRHDENRKVVPVSTFQARPNKKYPLWPVNTFYITTSPGEIEGVVELGEVAKIDFAQTPKGETVATITHNDHMKYSAPEFSFPDQ